MRIISGDSLSCLCLFTFFNNIKTCYNNPMKIEKLSNKQYPSQLAQIPQPPEKLYICGNLPPPDSLFLTVVGSRRHTSYGKEACEHILHGLRGYNVVIVSGLALGIDAIAHKTALDVGLTTIAIPGSGLDPQVLYPSTNRHLAEKIVSSGGALLSEFEPDFHATPYSFPQRNRIMAGLYRGVLVIEAEEKSGTLITARLATEYNRDVFVVPGSIFSLKSAGVHQLLKLGAVPVTSGEDILEHWGVCESSDVKREAPGMLDECSAEELEIISLLNEPLTKDVLIQKLNLPAHKVNILLSSLEIKGIIKESMGEVRVV